MPTTVDLKTLRRQPDVAVISINDNVYRMMDEAEKHQKSDPASTYKIGYDPKLGTFILYRKHNRRKY